MIIDRKHLKNPVRLLVSCKVDINDIYHNCTEAGSVKSCTDPRLHKPFWEMTTQCIFFIVDSIVSLKHILVATVIVKNPIVFSRDAGAGMTRSRVIANWTFPMALII